jgi:hypothetical protein
MMPLPNERSHGTNSDGTYNNDYCHHCFQNGKFTSEVTIDEMINISIKYVKDHYASEEKAHEDLNKKFSALKRWKKVAQGCQ